MTRKLITLVAAAAILGGSLAAPTGDPDAPGPFAFADADRMQRILSRSGFTDIEIERVTEKVGGKSLEEITDMLLQLGPLDEILAGLDGRTKHAIRADLGAALSQFETSGHVSLDAVAWLMTARAGA